MLRSISIDDFMTRNLVTATPDLDLLVLVDQLLEHGISGAPVVGDSGQVIGMVSEYDCLKTILIGTYQGDVGGTVSDVMSSIVETVPLGTSIVEAATQMVDSGRRRLPVVDGSGRLVGQVSRRDLLRAIRAYEIPEEDPAR